MRHEGVRRSGREARQEGSTVHPLGGAITLIDSFTIGDTTQFVVGLVAIGYHNHRNLLLLESGDHVGFKSTGHGSDVYTSTRGQ